MILLKYQLLEQEVAKFGARKQTAFENCRFSVVMALSLPAAELAEYCTSWANDTGTSVCCVIAWKVVAGRGTYVATGV